MVTDKRLFEDLARMAGGAASLLSTVGKQIKSDVSSHVGGVTGRLDLVDRKEFDRLMAMVTQLRLEQETLKAQIASLAGSKLGGSKAKTTSSKTASKSKPNIKAKAKHAGKKK